VCAHHQTGDDTAVLRGRQVHGGLQREVDRVVAHVADQADDLDAVAERGEPAAERVLAWEESPGEGGGDERDGRSARGVRAREAASAEQWNPHDPEVVRSHGAGVDL
jgi:hypothetical protein